MIFVHLFNDRSGSPTVLSSVIEVIGDSERDLLFVAEGNGVLASADIEKRYYRYRRRNSRTLTFFEYLVSQWRLFFLLFKETRNRLQTEEVYVNTAYPFAAGLFGWFSRRRVIYHLHEVSITPSILRWFLWGIVKLTASEIRFVSEHQRKMTGFQHENTRVIYNAMSRELADVANTRPECRGDGRFRVLMPSTMRDYKGVPEFFELARAFEADEEFLFQLVTNDDPDVVDHYVSGLPRVPSNLEMIPRTSDLAPLYRNASLVINLSRPEEWIETFGLTILEAMTFGVPVIAPPAGGPVELLSGHLETFLIGGTDMARLVSTLRNLQSNPKMYAEVSDLCLERASAFDRKLFVDALTAAD